MLKVAYITYNYKTAKLFMDEILNRAKEKFIDCKANFKTLDIITNDWHLTIIPMNCTNIEGKTFCVMDYACNNWECDVRHQISRKQFEYLLVVEKDIKTRFHPLTEWINSGLLKEIIGVV